MVFDVDRIRSASKGSEGATRRYDRGFLVLCPKLRIQRRILPINTQAHRYLRRFDMYVHGLLTLTESFTSRKKGGGGGPKIDVS